MPENALSQALNCEPENFSQNNVPLQFRCEIHYIQVRRGSWFWTDTAETSESSVV